MRYQLMPLMTIVLGCGDLSAQVPVLPEWIHQYNYGALPEYTVGRPHTKLAFDPSSGRLYRTVTHVAQAGIFEVQVFDADGTDLTPTPALSFHGAYTTTDHSTNDIVRLSAMNDTLQAVMHFVSLFVEERNLNWVQYMALDGSKDKLLGSGARPMFDAHRDQLGTLVQLEDELLVHNPSGWQTTTLMTAGARRMVVTPDRIYTGAPPDLTVIDRNTLAPLPPLSIASSGTAVTTDLLLNGNVLSYVAMIGNNTMDLGATDTTGESIWSEVITLPDSAYVSGIALDVIGDLWVSATRVAQGYIYRFDPLGTLTGFYSLGKTIDDITTSGTRIFITGQDADITYGTYVAAFDIGITDGMSSRDGTRFSIAPNPATSTITINDIAADTELITIVDATGRTIKELRGPFKAMVECSVTDLAPGSYFLHITGPAEKSALPFQVAH
ncbi:MAG: T9SS type A sorting domain-containing protein [Flavobacteriales bacterium]